MKKLQALMNSWDKRETLIDLLVIVGTALVYFGVAHYSQPIAMVVLGVILLALGVGSALRKTTEEPKC